MARTQSTWNMRRCFDDGICGLQRVAHLLADVKAARVVLVLILGTLSAVPLVVLTPPFQVPDEVQHFYRAYQLSELQIRAEVQSGVAGGTLPESLPEIVKASVYTRDGVLYPATPAPMTKTLRLKSIPLNPSAKRFIAFPRSAFYSPLPYLPQALGIALGRMIGLGPLSLLYLGRIFNCVTALALLGLAVNFTPFAEELIILVGLLPMSLFLYSSLSPDASIIGCALIFTALSISAAVHTNWRTGDLWIAVLAAVTFCSIKPVYVPILLVPVVPGIFRRGEAARAIRSHAILIGIVLGITASWLLFAKSTMTSPLSGVHPAEQGQLILHHPMVLIRALVHILTIGSLINLYFETVAAFGWLTVPLQPAVAYLLPVVSFIFVWKLGVCVPLERSAIRAFWHLTLALVSAALVVIAVYLLWVHVGQEDVPGVQGRYFIPILGLASVAMVELVPRRRPPAPRWQSLASIVVIWALETAAMDSTIIRAFHVF